MEERSSGSGVHRARRALLAGRRLRAERYDGYRARRSGYFFLIAVALGAIVVGVAAVAWIELVSVDMVARETEHIRALSRAEMELKR